MAPITAVTFDLWQTLIIDTPDLGRPRARRRMMGALRVFRDAGYGSLTFEDMQKASRRTYEICDKVRDAECDLTFDEQVATFIQEVDPVMAKAITPEVREAVAKEYVDSYHEYPPAIDAGSYQVLRTVKDMGLKVGLICNTGATPGSTQRVFLKDIGLAQYFDTFVFSDEERLSKPAARIFHLTLERLKATPEETVHIGDHHLNDVVGAKRAGLRAIWIRRNDKDQPALAPDMQVDGLLETLSALRTLLRE